MLRNCRVRPRQRNCDWTKKNLVTESAPLLAIGAIFLVVAAAPAVAAGDPVAHVTELPASAPAPAIDSTQVEQYAQRFEVSEKQSRESLEAQARGATIVNQLERALGADYAGVWFDDETGEFVVPVLNNPAGPESDVTKTAAQLQKSGLASAYRTTNADFSWTELQSAQEQLDAQLADQITSALVRTYLDPTTNAVVAETSPEAPKSVEADVQQFAKQSPVTIEVRPSSEPLAQAKLTGCNPYFWSKYCSIPLRGGTGLNIHNEPLLTCTIGYRARGWNGQPYVLTAGHCFGENPEAPPVKNWDSEDEFETSHYIGELASRAYVPHDWGKITATGSYWDVPSWPSKIVKWTAYNEPPGIVNEWYPIEAEGWAFVGQTVYHSGETTGTSWGVVKAVEETVAFETEFGMKTFNHMNRAKGGCAAGGDSGGPIFAAETALGMQTAAEYNKEHYCLEPTWWFTNVKEATSELGVTVVGSTPEVTITPASGISTNQATLNGQVTANRWSTSYRFEYGIGSYSNSTPELEAGTSTSPVAVSAPVTSLVSATTYQFRIKATNALGTVYSSEGNFTTLAEAPKARTEYATEVTAHNAVLNGEVNPNGSASRYQFEYDTKEYKVGEGPHGTKVPLTPAGVGSGRSYVSVHQAISGLEDETRYYFRIVAENAGGTTYSGQTSLLTKADPPEVVTKPATSVSATEATLNGTVNPKGAYTEYWFEYGKTSVEEHGIAGGSAGSGRTAVAEAKTATGLTPGTKYVFRIRATNSGGTSYGKEESLTTPATTPSINGVEAYEIGTFEPLLKATINPDGKDTTYYFEYGEVGGPGTKIPTTPKDIGAEPIAQAVSQRLSKLKANTTYWFKAVATNELGTTEESAFLGLTTPAAVWKINGEQPYEPVADAWSGTLTLTDFMFGYEVAIECNSSGKGTVGRGAWNQESSWTLSGCYARSGGSYCSSPTIEMRNQPWQSELTDTGEPIRDSFGPNATGRAGFLIKCHGGVFSEDLCEGALSATMTNTVYGRVEASGSETIECTLSGAGRSSVRLNEQIESPYGYYLSVARIPARPSATTEAPTEVKVHTATLHGTVNPQLLDTHYHFEYDTKIYYWGEGPHGTSVPVPAQDIGSEGKNVAVSNSISGLESSTIYYYRVVAENSEGTNYGYQRSFKTEPPPTASQLGAMGLTDPFNATNSAISNFGTNWSVLGWAAEKGLDRTTGWGPSAAYSTVTGAYYAPTVSDTGSGLADIATMSENPSIESRYFSLWLDMPTPGGAKAGYQLTFIDTATNTYEVKLSKWVSGTQTVLASKSGYSFANGNSFALADEGATVSAWTNTGSGFTELLSAADSTYSGGKAGVDGAGNITRLTNFKVGQLLAKVTNMNAALEALQLNDTFERTESPLSNGGAWAALMWDNGTSGHNTGQVATGWGPYDAYPTINGAYWQKTSFADTGSGDAVACKLGRNPEISSRYFALWLNAPSPGSARSGYQARFLETSASVYTVTLAKWQSGTETALASKTGYSFALNSKLALADKAGTVSVWTKTGTEYTQLLSASDATFTSGYAGVEGEGNNTRLKEFRSSPLAPF